MLVKTRAIVLHFTKYGESSIIVSMYTEMYGRQSFHINAVRTNKSTYPASFFQPLTILEMDIYHKPGRDIQRIKEISCPWHFNTIPFRVEKSSVALFIAEILFKTLKEEEKNPQLFEFLFNSIQLLDVKNENIGNFHLVFLLQYSKFLGIYPLENPTEKFSINQSLLPFAVDFNEAERKLLLQLSEASLSNLDVLNFPYSMRGVMLDKLVNFFVFHLDQNIKIRSLTVLKDVFKR